MTDCVFWYPQIQSVFLPDVQFPEEDYLYPNQTILIPKNNMNYYITTDTDTLNDISKIMNVNIIDLINQNNNIFLKKGQLIIYKEK